LSPTFHSLRNRNYRLYASGGAVSNVGTWMQRVAQDWLVLQLTHGSGTAIGITTGLQFLPMLLLGPWGGLIADRFPKRRVLVATQASMGSLAVVLGLLDVAGVVNVWHVFAFALLRGIVTAVDNPARQSFVVEMVGRDDLQNAVGLNSASFNAARIVGPAAAGVLIVLIGTGPLFIVNGFSFLAVIAALRAMRESDLNASPPARRGGGMVREGIRYVRGRSDLMLIIVIVGFVGTFGLNFQMVNALMATGVFHRGAGSYGLLGSIMAIGSLSGALLAARRGRPRQRLIVGSALAFGGLEIIAGLMPEYWLYAALLIPVGVSSLTLITAANATMQLSVAPAMRGRVMALYMAVFMGGTPFGAPVVGWLGSTFGPRWSLLSGGAISVIATAVAAGLLARRKGLVVRAHVRPRPHFDVLTAHEAQVAREVVLAEHARAS
jgi:MFS family permease